MRQTICLSVLFLLYIGISIAACSPVQFCEVDETKGIDICIALTTSTNTLSNSSDTNILISSKFVGRRGWTAFGIGDRMSGALMIIVYPGGNPDRMDQMLQKVELRLTLR